MVEEGAMSQELIRGLTNGISERQKSLLVGLTLHHPSNTDISFGWPFNSFSSTASEILVRS